MRAIKSLFALMLIAYPLSAFGQGVEQLADKLMSMRDYLENASFEVLLPSAQDPVTYNIVLQSSAPEQPDSLCPANYVIRWETNGPSGALTGFSAYFDGNHYRYRNNKLQEYHFDDNPEVFMPRGYGSQYASGVQCQAQFSDLLPQFLGMKMAEIANDTAYAYEFHPDTIVSGKRSIAIEGTKRNAGYDVANFKYVFDYSTYKPVLVDLETSPGAISEQLITVNYTGAASFSPAIGYSEEALIAANPVVFEKYRESTFRSESLIGNALPEFSSQTINGGNRYIHNRNEGFDTPVIIVALDPDVASTKATIQAIRDAKALLPMPVTAIFAFNTNRTHAIEDAIGDMQPDETALMSAGSLIRNCGVAVFPTTIIVNANGNVTDVIAGYNNDMASDVIQKCSVLQ